MRPHLSHRRGFTLVEVLLVLGVLAVFASMAIPSVMRMFNQQKLTESAEAVRMLAASARIRAIESGLIYQFCYETGGTRFVVVPFELDHAGSSTGTSNAAAPVMLSSRASGHMHQGVVFSTPPTPAGVLVAATTSMKLAASSLDGLPNASELAGCNWSAPILFHPDGSANMDTEIIIRDQHSQSVTLRVRAFTGSVSMERLVAGKRR
ncbi:prepilin-type N-terminal cleavage/methylation domain-containing protein [Schlesneria paludicola]|uniref:prepilin-type N-terminal cleavage/methylation domain-containing protein n=1 Tax=Schlesneria paludicola TaxID=360056 RepID=UPI00029A6D7B|nr:prepilin-type N-terminal cleavage/methylation domain-containing protein [Schlesneria paludicola]